MAEIKQPKIIPTGPSGLASSMMQGAGVETLKATTGGDFANIAISRHETLKANAKKNRMSDLSVEANRQFIELRDKYREGEDIEGYGVERDMRIDGLLEGEDLNDVDIRTIQNKFLLRTDTFQASLVDGVYQKSDVKRKENDQANVDMNFTLLRELNDGISDAKRRQGAHGVTEQEQIDLDLFLTDSQDAKMDIYQELLDMTVTKNSYDGSAMHDESTVYKQFDAFQADDYRALFMGMVYNDGADEADIDAHIKSILSTQPLKTKDGKTYGVTDFYADPESPSYDMKPTRVGDILQGDERKALVTDLVNYKSSLAQGKAKATAQTRDDAAFEISGAITRSREEMKDSYKLPDDVLAIKSIDADTFIIETPMGGFTFRPSSWDAPEMDQFNGDDALAYVTEQIKGGQWSVNFEGAGVYDRSKGLLIRHNEDGTTETLGELMLSAGKASAMHNSTSYIMQQGELQSHTSSKVHRDLGPRSKYEVQAIDILVAEQEAFVPNVGSFEMYLKESNNRPLVAQAKMDAATKALVDEHRIGQATLFVNAMSPSQVKGFRAEYRNLAGDNAILAEEYSAEIDAMIKRKNNEIMTNPDAMYRKNNKPADDWFTNYRENRYDSLEPHEQASFDALERDTKYQSLKHIAGKDVVVPYFSQEQEGKVAALLESTDPPDIVSESLVAMFDEMEEQAGPYYKDAFGALAENVGIVAGENGTLATRNMLGPKSMRSFSQHPDWLEKKRMNNDLDSTDGRKFKRSDAVTAAEREVQRMLSDFPFKSYGAQTTLTNDMADAMKYDMITYNMSADDAAAMYGKAFRDNFVSVSSGHDKPMQIDKDEFNALNDDSKELLTDPELNRYLVQAVVNDFALKENITNPRMGILTGLVTSPNETDHRTELNFDLQNAPRLVAFKRPHGTTIGLVVGDDSNPVMVNIPGMGSSTAMFEIELSELNRRYGEHARKMGNVKAEKVFTASSSGPFGAETTKYVPDRPETWDEEYGDFKPLNADGTVSLPMFMNKLIGFGEGVSQPGISTRPKKSDLDDMRKKEEQDASERAYKDFILRSGGL